MTMMRFTPSLLTDPKGRARVDQDTVDNLIATLLTTEGLYAVEAVTRLYGDNIGTCCGNDDHACHMGAPVTYVTWRNRDSLTDHFTEITYCPEMTR